MEKMSYEEYMKFFQKFNFDSLESLYTLIPCEGRDENKAYINVYNQKFAEQEGNYESVEEYYDNTRRLNCNIQKITTSLDINSLNQKELIYFKKLLGEIKTDNKKINGVLTHEELVVLFNKYSLYELDILKMIFSYIESRNIYEEFKTLEIVYSKIENKCYFGYDKLDNQFRPTNIANKNNQLNNKELSYLSELVEEASFYLSSIQDYSDEYENSLEDFDLSNYPIRFVEKFDLSLDKEIEQRKTKKRVR